ncbi:MAG TPA: hypothetical protein VLH79_09390 [Chthonomonadales bacterium]|nr:hypothetical protein [Chthonomonadales bacterium]
MNEGCHIDVRPRVPAPLDSAFRPAALVARAHADLVRAEGGGSPLRIALERGSGFVSVWETRVLPPDHPAFGLSLRLAERAVKFLLWQRGGWKVTVGAFAEVGSHIGSIYAPGGPRAFDARFMGNVFEAPFTIVVVDPDNVPEPRESAAAIGRHLDGCRVGFDLGASDRKASAVIDGDAVFSEEVPWDPRNQSDPTYHYNGVMDSIRRAASHLPRLDAVGGSAAGIYIDNRARVASLFRGVPQEAFALHIADLFLRIGHELGVPIEVANDGDVTALAGSMSLGENPVLGLAFGSSLAAGYVDAQGRITGWLNELAFAPIDDRTDAPVDEWSGDAGCGVQYLSQVGAVRVAEGAGIDLGAGRPLPEKLEALQARMAAGEERVRQVYETLGVYLGYAVAHYASFYELRHILALGRVTTGRGGDVMMEVANRVLAADFPEVAEKVRLALPDEKSRRVGQSIAAASLPALAR